MSETLSLRGTLEGHAGWVTAIATPLDPASDVVLSASRDKSVIVWNLTREEGAAYGHPRRALRGHSHFVQDVVISSDGQFALSGSWDGTLRLWDLAEGKRLYSLDAGDAISALTFSPNRYWLCAATASCVKIWDLESKSTVVELRPDFPPTSKKGVQHSCTSLAWSADGATLYTGYTDGVIRVWGVNRAI